MTWLPRTATHRGARRAFSCATRAALIASLGACGGPGDAPLRIGVVGPTQLIYGQSMSAAARLFQEQLNAAGGIDGRRVEVVIRDDAADGEAAIGIATEFAADPAVVAVVGHVTSGAELAAAGVYEDSGLVAVSPSATSPDVSRAGEWIFRVCPSDIAHGLALARWVRSGLSLERVVVLYANDAYGRGVLAGFAGEFEDAGGTVLSRDPFLTETTQDSAGVDPYLRRAMGRDAQAIVVAGLANEAASIIAAARRLGFAGPILGGEGLLGVETAGPVTEGVYVSAPFLPDGTTGAARAWVEAYEQEYGDPPDAFAAQTWDALQLVALAIDEAGADRAAVRDYLAAVGDGRPAFEGVTGTIAFDANGDVPDKPVAIGRIQGGRVQHAGGS
jgi:branched-chain amino acid transport system substrate-binding protein